MVADTEVGKMPTGTEVWTEVLQSLKLQMTLATYRSVFEGSRAGLFDGEVLDVALVSENACEWARQRLGHIVERAVVDVVRGGGCHAPVRVRFSAGSGNGGRSTPPLSPPGGGEGDVRSPTDVGEGIDPQVGDKRRVRWYRVDNVVLDDYLPLMGLRAFAVYSLYCRMSGRDGLSWPGYDYICRTLKIGRSTVSQCNSILEALGLIEIDRGNQERSNRYYLLEPEVLTEMVLQTVWTRANDLGLKGLLASVEVVLGEDYPSPGSGLPQSPVGTTPVPSEDYPSPGGGLEQDLSNKTQEQDTGTSPPLCPPLEGGNGIEAVCSRQIESDNDVTDWLVEVGMGRSLALKLVIAHDRGRIVAWIEYMTAQETIKNPVGFLRSRLELGDWPPGGG